MRLDDLIDRKEFHEEIDLIIDSRDALLIDVMVNNLKRVKRDLEFEELFEEYRGLNRELKELDITPRRLDSHSRWKIDKPKNINGVRRKGNVFFLSESE